MSVSRDAIMRELAKVPDPCSIAMGDPLDIDEMGLVEDVAIDAGHVQVTLVLTDPSCVHFRSMQRFVVDLLSAVDGVQSVEVLMSTRQLWTPDRIRRRTPARTSASPTASRVPGCST
jgi:metal-sulfur cluster biosynthetic enzyme